jgi:hypothetical protein
MMNITYAGLFEAHITVANLSPSESKRFTETCNQLNIKAIQIELSRGDVPIQPMTCSTHKGNFTTVLKEVTELARHLKQAGFEVTRQKMEAAPFNQGIPMTAADAQNHPVDNYFEHHLKILFETESNLAEIQRVCMAHGAHLSRNAFENRANHSKTYFITLRCYSMGLEEATIRFNALKHAITHLKINILKNITEYCVYDDRLNLDANWLTEENASSKEPLPCTVCTQFCLK